MSTVIDNTPPVVFQNPITGRIEAMPVEMINAYTDFDLNLGLQKCAEIAARRDHEAAENLLLSITDPIPAILERREGIPDEVTAEPLAMA